jgi:hypothetical protein
MLHDQTGVKQLREGCTRSEALALFAALCNLGSGVSAAAKPIITTFDPPGSDATIALSINASGAIAGYYRDSVGPHGFMRASDGTITTF